MFRHLQKATIRQWKYTVLLKRTQLTCTEWLYSLNTSENVRGIQVVPVKNIFLYQHMALCPLVAVC